MNHRQLEKQMEVKRMYENQCNPSTLGGGCDVVRNDVKKMIQNEVQYTEAELERLNEQLRVAKEKLRLIEKNKDLEAYLNLLNR